MLNNLMTKSYIALTEGLRNFKEDNKGVTAIEYGLIALAVAVFVIFVFTNDGGFIAQMKNKFHELGESIKGFTVKNK